MAYTYNFERSSGHFNPIELKLFNKATESEPIISPDDYIKWLKTSITGVNKVKIMHLPGGDAFYAKSLTFENEEYYIAFLLKYT